MRVLIVEDDAFIAMDLLSTLREGGHEAVGVARGFDGALALAHAERPNVALVDYRLQGGIDGITVARHLRRLGVAVVYVTGNDHEVRLIDGTAEIVRKPYDKQELLQAVERVMRSA